MGYNPFYSPGYIDVDYLPNLADEFKLDLENSKPFYKYPMKEQVDEDEEESKTEEPPEHANSQSQST